MPLEREDVEAALKRKGFMPGGSDHRHFTYYMRSGKKTSVWTKTSHGSGYKTLGDDLVQKMARQCGLTKPQFTKLVECPLTQDEFEQILVGSGRVKVR